MSNNCKDCNDKLYVNCDRIASCINKELYYITNSQPTDLINFCTAVSKCVDQQFFNIASGLANAFPHFSPALIKSLQSLPDYDPDDVLVLTTDGGELHWAEGGSGGGDGTVTFVSAGNLFPLFTTTESNQSTTPNITFNLNTQSANRVFAGPISGGLAAPTFRALVANDIPLLDNLYFQQGGNSFGSIARLGTNDNNSLEFETNNTKVAEFTTSGQFLIGTPAFGSNKLQVGGNTYINGNLGIKTSNSTNTITIGSDTDSTPTMFVYAPDSLTAAVEALTGVSLELRGRSNIKLIPDFGSNDGSIVIDDTPAGYVSEQFFTGTNLKAGEIGLAMLDAGDNILELYLKGIDPGGGQTSELTLYNKMRFIGIPQDDTTTKLISIDLNNRVRWRDSATFAPATGSSNYIQNQFSAPQSSSNWWISGHGRVNDYLQIHNSGRFVPDISNTLSITNSGSSTQGSDLRLRAIKFFADIAPYDTLCNTARISAPLNDLVQVDGNFTVNGNILAIQAVGDPSQYPQINVGAGNPLKIRGNDTTNNSVDFVDLWNLNIANGNANTDRTYIAFSAMKENGTPLDNLTNRGTKQIYGRIGTIATDRTQSAYKADLVFQTVDATVNSGLGSEQFRIQHDGQLIVQNIPHETTDVDRFLVYNPSTKVIKYRTGTEILSDIGGGAGGGSGTVTSVAVSSTDLSVSGSPITTSGTITLNVNNNAITFAKMQDIGVGLIGNDSGTADPKLITIGSGLQISGGVLSATVGGGTPTLQQVLTSGSTLTGNNTVNAGGFNFTLNNNAIITLGTTAAQVILDNAGQDLTLASTDKAFFKIASFGSATPGDVLTITDTATGEVAWAAPGGGGGGGSVTNFSAGNLSPLFTTNVATSTSTPALTFSLTNAGAHTYFGNNTGSTGAPAYRSNAALTKSDDTNVTLTLGGAPTTSLLEAVSLTLGWSGQLSIARGGTGLGALGTALQQLRVNAGATALEYFTPSTSINSLNSLTASSQTFATGTSGSDFNISSSVSTHTFNIPDASTSNRGLITTGSQTFGGTKNFNVGVNINNSGGDNDFRVSGDNITNLLYSDASVDRIGIGTNTPVALLHVSQGANTFTGVANPTVFIDAGNTTTYNMELKGSAVYSGLLISNTGPFNSPFLQLCNEGNNVYWTHQLHTDNSYSIIEGKAGETQRLTFAPSSGTVTLLGNLTLLNKINKYNNTAILNGEVLIGHTANGTFEKASITGTTNQVNVTAGAGTLTLSLPQNIHTAATPQFAGVGIGMAGGSGLGVAIGGTFTTAGLAYVGTTITPSASASSSLMSIAGTIVEAGSGNHPLFAGLSLTAPTVTPGSATVTNTATLWISGAPSATVTGHNDAIWVVGGTTRLDGDLVPAAPTYSSGGYDVLVKNQSTGRVEKTTISSGSVITVVSSAASLTLATPNTHYVFTGTTSTWTLPAVSGNTNVVFTAKNRGSGNITFQRGGSDQIYDASAVNSITILPGQAYTVVNDGTYWVVV